MTNQIFGTYFFFLLTFSKLKKNYSPQSFGKIIGNKKMIYKMTSQINQSNDEDFENDIEDVLAAKRGYVTKKSL